MFISNSYVEWIQHLASKCAISATALLHSSICYRLHETFLHEQLSDKVHTIRKHVQFAIGKCDHDADILREKVDNIVYNYKNIHDRCSVESRCRVDVKNEPSKLILTSQVAEKLLIAALQQIVVYKSQQDNIFARDTYWVFQQHPEYVSW